MRYLSLLFLLPLLSCGDKSPATETTATEAKAPEGLNFMSRIIVDSVNTWWALAIGDVDGDDLMDAVYINNNANGGYLAYRSGQREGGIWRETIIAQEPPTGGTFASGDLEVGDMDGDGDTDVLAVKHTGEWDDAAAPAEVFWYEAPNWTPHTVGEARGAVKDLSIGDFDGDGRNDLAVLTFNNENLRIHRSNEDATSTTVADITAPGLHEGMDVGDLDGDGDLDIAANGYVFMNPGGDLTGEWRRESVSDRWYTQTGDWSANGTKNALADMDGDGSPEIFITHSERGGYPLAMYDRRDDGSYAETIIIDSIPAAHTLQIFDMDLDGDLDIVTGINKGRAVNIDVPDNHHVLVVLNNGDGSWTEQVIEEGGIYNGRVADFEGDGDYDIFRLPEHQATNLYLLENQAARSK
jgi:hypothetical protein